MRGGDSGDADERTPLHVQMQRQPLLDHGAHASTRRRYDAVEGEGFPRLVTVNNAAENEAREYPSNAVRSTKYRWYTFIPRNLYEQFRRWANFYFLAICVLNFIPAVVPGGFTPVTSVLPLVFVLAVSAVKEAYEDVLRARADRESNLMVATRIVDGARETVPRQDLRVGDLVEVREGQEFPADLVLLSSLPPHLAGEAASRMSLSTASFAAAEAAAQDDGTCWIETSSLDGEANLKVRSPLHATQRYHSSTLLAGLSCVLAVTKPSADLGNFEGQLRMSDDPSVALPLTPDQLLLRGARLRRNERIYGVVVFSGSDTKIMLNQQPAPSKRTRVEMYLNRIFFSIFAFEMLLCVVSAGLGTAWEISAQPRAWYLMLQGGVGYIVANGIPRFFTFIVLYNDVIPISLYVSVEIVKFLQARFIEQDIRLYDEEHDQRAVANTSNLLEELGQVEYVFTDKTGTLTRNNLRLHVLSLPGKQLLIDSVRDSPREPLDVSSSLDVEYGADSAGGLGGAKLALARDFVDDPDLRQLMLALTLCHEVYVVEDELEASSPDDEAFVRGASKVGFRLVKREQNGFQVQLPGEGSVLKARLMHMIKFSSERKCMSVVVRMPDSRIVLYCKGADTVIRPLLIDNGSRTASAVMLDDLESFAAQGLRTLCFTAREVSEAEYVKWSARLRSAESETTSRERKIGDAWREIERDLTLLGTVGVEDQLQEGVPDTIASLLKANVRVWMLTGDKRVTAESIGMSCALIRADSSRLRVVDAENADHCLAMLDNAYRHYRRMTAGERESSVLIVDGTSLVYALHGACRAKLQAMGMLVSAVIVCRCSPKQKSEVVRLVNNVPAKPVTLAIGDGANDVSMIQTANVGVGIVGREGRQAARSADYAFGQFRFLKRLLFVHGRHNYVRITTLVQYSFYKNIAFTLPLFYFSFYSGFSGQTMYNPYLMMVFNIVFTSLPIMVLGLFDKDVDDNDALSMATHLYSRSRLNADMNVITVGLWFANAVWHSLVVYFGVYLVVYGVGSGDGRTTYLYSLGTVMLSVCIVIVTLQVALHTNRWNVFSHITYWGSLLAYFLLLIPFCALPVAVPDMAGVFQLLAAEPLFWLAMFSLIVVALMPQVFMAMLRVLYYPSNTQIVLEWHAVRKRAGANGRSPPSLAAERASTIVHVPDIDAEHHAPVEASIDDASSLAIASRARATQLRSSTGAGAPAHHVVPVHATLAGEHSSLLRKASKDS